MILRGKRAAAQGDGGGKRRFKSLSGRRVSFAPDDELETMHLFTDKKTPSPLPQQQAGTQPLGELQNLVHGTPSQQGAPQAAARQPRFDSSHSPVFGAGGKGGAAAAAAASPGGPFSPTMSMEITNDTIQQEAAAIAAAADAAARGTPSRFRGAGGGGDDDMSLTLDGGAPGGAAGAGYDGTGTFNITDNVPGLSTLVEEDEEAFAVESAGGNDGTAEMDLTGLTGGAGFAPAAPRAGLPSPSPGRYNTRRSSRGDADAHVGAAAAAATPVGADAAAAAVTPGSSRRRSGARSAAAAGSVSPMIMFTPPSATRTTPAHGRASAAKSPAPAASAAARAPASVSPSPLRRSARRSAGQAASPLPAALQAVQEAEEEHVPLSDSHEQDAAQDEPREKMQEEGLEEQLEGQEEGEQEGEQGEEQEEEPGPTARAPSPLALSPVATEQTVDTSALRDKWGFVPGDDENTMNLELDRHGPPCC
ncbi:hypothetical protein MNEG_11094 [Monoraphidium neglectum]|uniref:Uncharacterized protein n=1 Tax=Monoraphidium neglectum TaxID=145388 RepID=A0A0D2MQD0_9CHLO|nr:hypothetical protein MNEG_11094 [Monoraphidium neglectum]KIY96870.1 hypothetical protein MNEG_11094 [Monoraphidium neglectum]|eukprot:XP_013895890.1 hypothetical protein MNEG_11094 [Monoraphidium neglectum]